MNERMEKRRDFLISVGYFATIALIVFLVYKYALRLILPFLIAFILVAIFAPLARRLNKKLKIKTEILSFIIMLLMYLIIGVLLFLLILQIVNWSQRLYHYLPDLYYDTIKPSFTQFVEFIDSYAKQLPETMQKGILTFQTSLETSFDNLIDSASKTGLSQIGKFTSAIPSFLVAFIFTILLSFFISLQYDKVIGFFRRQMSPRVEHLISETKKILYTSVGQYVKALLILMAITFVELTIGFFILGISHAIPIAAGTALLDALPVFGTGFVLVPWAALAFLQGDYRVAVGMLIIYGVVSLIRKAIEPKIVGDQLGLNPIVSLVSIYLGFKLFGVLGMIFMPIVTQILIEFHKRGIIQLFQEDASEPITECEGSPENESTDKF